LHYPDYLKRSDENYGIVVYRPLDLPKSLDVAMEKNSGR